MTELWHGFREVRQTEISELNATLHELEHEKTGAGLLWLERDEENKTFGITFETLPWNDTGVFHILEHSVLNGSDKFPVKEPFVELLKHSMNTFLNALTFPDKTMYPIASRNEKDFINLMRVYLDAVLHPLIYSRPEIFRQEGWHHEIDENGAVSYKGVVFNEMKGAFADPETLADNAITRALFPDTPYAFVSGGDPASIPDLSYEEFIGAHRKFYSPSNSTIFLDGKMDMEKVLGIIDEEYLSEFPKTERLAAPAMQSAVDGGVKELQYEIGPEEEEDGHTKLYYSYVIGTYEDREKMTALQAISEVLAGNNQAPVCRAILEEGLAEDVYMRINDGMSQPFVTIQLNNVKTENIARAEEVLFEQLNKAADEGLDREVLSSVLSNMEFSARERDFGSYPQGIIFLMQVMETYLYGGDPAQNLQVGSLFDDLRAKMEEGGFEDLLKELILNNDHKAKTVLIPSRSCGEARRDREAARLEAEEKAWSEEDRAEKVRQQESLTAWQNSEDTPEQLATLPSLTLEDIEEEPEDYPTVVSSIAGVPFLKHEIAASGITYVNFYFKIDGIEEKDLMTLSLMSQLYGNLNTVNSDVITLMTKGRNLLGNYGFSTTGTQNKDNADQVDQRFNVSFSVLEKNMKQAVEYFREILTETVWDNEQFIREIISQMRQELMQQIVMSGTGTAAGRVNAQYTAVGRCAEVAGGFEFYRWIKELDEKEDLSDLIADMKRLASTIPAKDALTVSVTGIPGMEDLKAFGEGLYSMLEVLPARSPFDGVTRIRKTGVCREAIVIPADIAFTARGGLLNEFGGKYSPVHNLVSKVVTFGYLWNTIRVQGGAYGTSFAVRDNGVMTATSYRDPGAKNSLETYRSIGSFLRENMAENPDLTGSIIGTISDSSPLLTARMKGITADILYFRGRTFEERKENRKKILNAKAEDILALVDCMEKTMENGGCCVVAGQNQVDGLEGLDQVYTI